MLRTRCPDIGRLVAHSGLISVAFLDWRSVTDFLADPSLSGLGSGARTDQSGPADCHGQEGGQESGSASGAATIHLLSWGSSVCRGLRATFRWRKRDALFERRMREIRTFGATSGDWNVDSTIRATRLEDYS